MENVIEPVRRELADFEIAFEKLLHSDIPLAEKVVRYIAKHKGKRLRPILVFLSGRLMGELNGKTMSAGIVVELLHTATLVHDDVVDDSDLRRGYATVNNLWTNKISVLVGDLLFSRTLSTILDIKDHDALEIFSKTAKEITEGELLQIERDHDYEMDELVYFDLISKKTASLFGASCELGALTVNASFEERDRMRTFGRNLGVAFQIKDDLLDYIGDEKKLGKPRGNDIRENKVTLPLIFTLKNVSKAEKEKILAILNNGELVDDRISQIVELVNHNGGVDYSLAIARQYGEKALNILECYPDSEFKSALQNLVEFTIIREK